VHSPQEPISLDEWPGDAGGLGSPWEPDGFAALFDREFAGLWRYLRRRVIASADADDLTAEVFATAWRRRESLASVDDARLWLYGIARNLLRNHHRSTIRRARLQERLIRHTPTHHHDVPTADPTLWRALASLPSADRDLLLMRSWDQLSVAEIAVILDCTTNAVSVRLYRAKQRLRTELVALATDNRSEGHEANEPERDGDT
jgi:RNA polymerase sigma-70 factor (ECF subfamily)